MLPTTENIRSANYERKARNKSFAVVEKHQVQARCLISRTREWTKAPCPLKETDVEVYALVDTARSIGAKEMSAIV
eukprot:scaffold211039_cov19-Tisochrysis_lutea.AAC.1